ncbi:hypothetical protein EDB87DRAFT_1678597 [Lactarius vividus]|nr:hypothetical protein EDB87DRAFT_1678597 [Lactarius vividus]
MTRVFVTPILVVAVRAGKNAAFASLEPPASDHKSRAHPHTSRHPRRHPSRSHQISPPTPGRSNSGSGSLRPFPMRTSSPRVRSPSNSSSPLPQPPARRLVERGPAAASRTAAGRPWTPTVERRRGYAAQLDGIGEKYDG